MGGSRGLGICYVTSVLGHMPVVTSSESEALRSVQMLRVDVAIIDCFDLAEDEYAALSASCESLSAEQSRPVICIVGQGVAIHAPGWGRQPPL